MTAMDKITEEIAHFIGLFQVTAERAIQRDAYEEFLASKAVDPLLDMPPMGNLPFAAPFEFLGYDPEVRYLGSGPDLVLMAPWKLPLPHLPQTPFDLWSYGDAGFPWLKSGLPGPSGAVLSPLPPELEPIGSVVTYANQIVYLSDNDYFGVGGHGLYFTPKLVSNDALLDAADMAVSHSPLNALEKPGSSEEIIATIKAAGTALSDFTPDPDSPFETFVHKATSIEGIYVNGKLVDEAPKLEDYRPTEDDDESDEQDGDIFTGNVTIGEDGSFLVQASVTITAGGNTLVNEAVLKSFWTGGTVTAVVGDHYEINAIVQITALWDVDKIACEVGDWESDGLVNAAFNIAEFERIDTSDDDTAADETDFPDFWRVTTVEGDLLMVNWLEQFIFMSDNDVGIVSSSGVTTRVVSGDNMGINHTSILDLGFAYDLIIVGGNVYDANLIQQISVLFDNDSVCAVPGFQTTGAGTASTAGNLLWNQAYIGNVGNANGFEALPSHYLAAAKALQQKGHEAKAPHDVLTDGAFAGLNGLSVLYIKGDLLSLQYIKQTCVLGDSDQIALAMDQLKPHLDADWTVETGGNTLVNHAAIVDLDSFGKTYVGGQAYSQDTLIQAELISSKPDFGDPNVLANEAVAFLDDTMLEPAGETADGVYVPSAHEGQTDDGLQHILGH